MWFHFQSLVMQVDPKYLQNTDVLASIQSAFENFLKSGQAGALTIGLVMGYMIRGITK